MFPVEISSFDDFLKYSARLKTVVAPHATELLSKGAKMTEILEDYPELEMADIQAALHNAHNLVENEEVFERVAAS
jgi:Protein of unknown function (DUF433)